MKVRLFECMACGALVKATAVELHKQFHKTTPRQPKRLTVTNTCPHDVGTGDHCVMCSAIIDKLGRPIDLSSRYNTVGQPPVFAPRVTHDPYERPADDDINGLLYVPPELTTLPRRRPA